MLSLRVELIGDDLLCDVSKGSGPGSSRKPLRQDTLDRLAGWAATYDTAVWSGQTEPLVVIGREIAALLDEGDGWLTACLDGTGEIDLEIIVPADPCDRGRTLLDVPWELLAPGGVFLALDAVRLFRVARRLGAGGQPSAPAYSDMTLLFMATEVEGQRALDYEREEAMILQATARLDRLNLLVEESGSREGLRDRLALAGTVEALHVTTHGDIENGEPILALEKPDGGLDRVTVSGFCAALGGEDRHPRLAVLSACRSAEGGGAAGSFIQTLIRAGIANAVGWDGSVFDTDATLFAATFYRDLTEGGTVSHAAAVARRTMLHTHQANPDAGRHWHLARVYLGPAGGGALCDRTKAKRPHHRSVGTREFLDKKRNRVPVATAEQFVGQRRPMQQALRALGTGGRGDSKAGALIHGMGNAGKSSLAARLANRLPGLKTVVVVDHYDRRAVFTELTEALPPRERAAFRDAWEPEVNRGAAPLKDALQELLDGLFSGHQGTRPILLVIDDLEQRLRTPQPGEAATPFKTPEDGAVIGAIIAAFRDADSTDSRLLITSRYTFALTDSRGDDLGTRLHTIALPPMDAVQRDKQMRTAARLASRDGGPASKERAELEQRIIAAASGSPGLQECLSSPFLNNDHEATERAVAAVESYLATGKAPLEDSAAMKFFRQVSLEAFKAMLTAPEAAQLRATTLFSLPVPWTVLVTAGRAAGIAAPERALGRLQGLGLLDPYGMPGETPLGAITPLARPLVTALSPEEEARLAAAVITPLAAAWTDADGDFPIDPRGDEAARLALAADAPAPILTAAAVAAGYFLFRVRHNAEAALERVEAADTALKRRGETAAPSLLLLGAQCAERLGRAETQDRFLTRGLSTTTTDIRTHAILLCETASRRIQTGDIDAGEHMLRDAVNHFERLDDVRTKVITLGRIADILQDRRQFDEALRIHREERLPVFERLGDMRSKAVTRGQIADILQARGQIDEALRIYREEVLPVLEFLCEAREKTVILGKIAEILQARDQFDEALRIHREERLPVAKRLQDSDSIAHVRFRCASIRLARGGWEAGEAQTIHDELAESYSISLRLGCAGGIATVGTLYGQMLAGCGETEDGLLALEASATAYDTLQRPQDAAKVREIQDTIRKAKA